MFSISRFHTLMTQLPRRTFDQAVTDLSADKHRKGFDCWTQLQAMLFVQLSGASSLRTVVAGFNAQASHHYHLGARALKRSTLADANAQTDPQVFARTASALMQGLHRSLRQEGHELLCLLDSTSLTLKGPGFDHWTFDTRTRNTQGLKLHVLYTPGNAAPYLTEFSPANLNDIDVARTLPLDPKRRYVFDKGYCDYAWWKQIDDAGSIFVTRFKRNAALKIERSREVARDAPDGILEDQIVCFGHRHNRAGHHNPYTAPLRRISVQRQGKAPLVLATNDLDSPAAAIAEHYRARWGIELFFKWIKQHLQLKRFLGRSQNAVKNQVLTALIAYLLVLAYQKIHANHLTVWECLAMLSTALFQRPHVESARRTARQRQRLRQEFLDKQHAWTWSLA